MVEPSTLNLSLLPSVPVSDRAQLPSVPCIYFAIDSSGVVQYIGQSINLRQRWLTHDRLRRVLSLHEIKIAYLVTPVDVLGEIERALISWFQPCLNKQGTGGGLKKVDGIRIRQIKEVEVTGLGDRIRQARSKSPKPLDQLCDEVGVSRTYWYDIEKETLKGALSIENLRKIETALDVDFGVKLDS